LMPAGHFAVEGELSFKIFLQTAAAPEFEK
jgi:hypothetical protein